MGPGGHAAVGALLAAALLLSAAVPGARAQAETEDEDFSYIPSADNGPENWGKIKAEWANCSVGRMQSPIDLSDECAKLVQCLGYLITSYRPAEATIVNTGHYVMVSFNGDAGSLVINGTTYNLKQLHWHTPSEHTIAGRRYDLELHLVHQTSANKTAVIGILYEIGAIKDPFLLWLEPSIKSIENTNDQPKDIRVVDPNGARGIGSVYYRYMGSLTTPPCTEGVVWTVVNKVSPVAKDQVKLLRDALQDGNTMNARPLQEVNNRDISIFRPKPYDYY
ncbi:bifunctional monodehydroascorbate reductase and carbonic anhydrase nectarin-3-like [Miscanthus floridulus]|uniref:bifunctional monodehydroascorbate reductase and carbonic anhydrase nectarin-3-like n=1 Tax=Miscanthus floridulus TaxID=154761 RepID=UPI003458BD25